MKKLGFIKCVGMVSAMQLTLSCGSDTPLDGGDDSQQQAINTSIDENFSTNTNENFNTDGCVTIVFGAQSATITNPYADSGVAITASGADVVITSTSTDEVNYVLSGSTTEGSLKIYSDTKFGLILNGVSIVNSDDPALNIQSGKKASVTLVDGTSNRIAGGTSFASEDGEEDVKGAFFSEGKVVFSGNGSLVVMGRYRHAICSDDYVRIDGGKITVSVAAKDGIHANDYVELNGGTLEINAVGDGIDSEGYINLLGGDLKVTTTGEQAHGVKSETETTVQTAGTIDINVQGTASKAFKCDGDMEISSGTVAIATSGNAFYDEDDADISSAAGIKCGGNLAISGGTVTIASSGSGGKGISVDGTFTVSGCDISVTTTGGTFTYGDDDTSAKAIKSDGDLTVNSGNLVINTSESGAEGLESKANLTINGGNIEIEAYDDCINASSSITINGGEIYACSQTNDGIDSNGTLTITGGTVVAVGTSSPEEGIDCDQNTFKITGGTIIGLGGATSTPTSSVTTQCALIVSTRTTQKSALNIKDSSGKDIITFVAPKTFSQATFLCSSADLKIGGSYTISSGGSVTGGTSFHGLYSGGTYSGGSTVSTVTISSVVTGGSNGGFGGGGNMPGGGGGR